MIYYRLIILVIFEIFLVSCQTQPVKEKPVSPKKEVVDVQVKQAPVVPVVPVIPKAECKKPEKKVKPSHDLPVLGQIETAVIMPAGLVLKARIDTGATTSSIGVDNLEQYERDGKPWVKFTIKDPKTGKPKEFNIKRKRKVRIKQHGSDSVRRPVVKLRVIIGKIDQVREFTLADRDSFDYPILIGRNYLMDAAIVDVSQKHAVQTRVPKK